MVRAALSHRLSISVHSTSRTRLACPSCHVRRKPRARTVAILFWIFSDSPARLSHLDDIFIASSRARTRNTWFFFEEKEKNQKIPREKIPFNRSPPSSFIEISVRYASHNTFWTSFESLSLWKNASQFFALCNKYGTRKESLKKIERRSPRPRWNRWWWHVE